MQLAGAVNVVVRGPALDILDQLSLHLVLAVTMLLTESNIGTLRNVESSHEICKLSKVGGVVRVEGGKRMSRDVILLKSGH